MMAIPPVIGCSVRSRCPEAYTRPHDVIIRYGGDEFVCGLMGLTHTGAAKRLAVVNAALGRGF